MVLMITYDLSEPGQKYDEIKEVINANSSAWCKYFTTTWLVKTSLSPNQMVAQLKAVIDSNDSLLVIEVVNNYQGLLTADKWKYIRENIFG